MTTPEQEALFLIEQLGDVLEANRIQEEYWRPCPPGAVTGGPYDWQVSFHNAGAKYRERCLMAANRVGKTRTVGVEVAIHLTGLYPPWWKGHRFARPIEAWVGSESSESSRDIVQKELLGPDLGEGLGKGWIPRHLIEGKPSIRQAGIPDVVDAIQVRHKSGGLSRVGFKTYEQGRRKWQGTSKDLLWFDEEPPQDIFTEGLTRTLDRKGLTILSFTPLFGISEVVHHFMDGGSGIHLVQATWDDAPHLDDEARAQMLASYPEHERATRAKGVPMVGSGLIYGVPDERISCRAFKIPDHFRQIVGIDFGIDHPAAAVWLAHDPDHDILYVTDGYKVSGETPAYHAAAIKRRGDWIPVAWPHDGSHREKSSGTPLAENYRQHGLKMLPISARYQDRSGGGQSPEPVIMEIQERMRTGRFKVFEHLGEWFKEKRLYHRKEGLIVRKRDDLLSATHYAVMMRRFARPNEGSFRLQPGPASGYDPLASL